MKSHKKKKHHERSSLDSPSRKRDGTTLRRRNTKRSTSPAAKTGTIEAIRAYTADALKDCKTKPINLYDAGFQAALEEIGRMLDPGGYSCARPTTKLIAALQKASAMKSKAKLQSVEAVRDYLEEFFA